MDLNDQDMETVAMESDVSCFAVDGIVAEMTIEVDEDNGQQSQKTSKSYENEQFEETESSILESAVSEQSDWVKIDKTSKKKLLELDDKPLGDCEIVSSFSGKKSVDKEICASLEKEVLNMELLKQGKEESINMEEKEVLEEYNISLLEDKTDLIKKDKMHIDKDKIHMKEDKMDMENELEMQEDEMDMQEVEMDMQESEISMHLDEKEDKKSIQEHEKDTQVYENYTQVGKKDMQEDTKAMQEDKKEMQDNKKEMQERKKEKPDDQKEKQDSKKEMPKEEKKEVQEEGIKEILKEERREILKEEKKEIQEGDRKEIQVDRNKMHEDKKEKQDDKEMKEEKKANIHGIKNNADEQNQISERGIKRKLSVDDSPERYAKVKKPNKGKKCVWLTKRRRSVHKVRKIGKATTQKDPPKSGASDVPTQNSKALLNNEIKEGLGIKLGNILEVKKKVKNTKNVRSLYRVLYNKWYSCSAEEAQEQILEFSGFPFDETSPEFAKRRNILKVMADGNLAEICNSLNLIKGPKLYMISSVLKFLSKPHKPLHPSKDPSLQPVVKLERLSLNNTYLAKALENYVTSETSSENKLKNSTGKSTPAKVKQIKQSNTKKPSAVKGVHLKSKKMKKTLLKKQTLEKEKSEIQENLGKRRRKLREPFVQLKPLFEPSEKPNQDADISQKLTSQKERKDRQVSQKEQNDSQDRKNISVKDSVVVEDTSEGKKETSVVKSPVKKVGIYRLGKPLRMFTGINERIRKASFNVLQRLHILLFGASEKAENLKSNILAFGGFPFLEGSEEWKQKEFVLSLLAQNTLKEYLNLLCIEHRNDDPSVMISKLMRFLAAPNENFLGNEITEIETEVVSSELINNNTPAQIRAKGAVSKKRFRKREKRAAARWKKKVNDIQVKSMEADITVGKKTLTKEKKINANQTSNPLNTSHTKAPKLTEIAQIAERAKPAEVDLVKGVDAIKPLKQSMTDPEKLNALLQTVYKRRALKAAGAVISIPNKGQKTKLADLPNVKFLIVTANYNDLDILHHLIYMTDANKSKVRKNILDFDGFGFAEDSKKYNERIQFLSSLGYDVSKRIAFLLGLCPYKTDIPQQDLNELIMYFLMSPCKTKEVPITQMPHTLLAKDMPKELGQVMDRVKQKNIASLPHKKEQNKGNPLKVNTTGIKNGGIKTPETLRIQNKLPIPKKSSVPEKAVLSITTPGSFHQKAKKSLTPTAAPVKLAPVKKVVLSTQTSISPLITKPPSPLITKPPVTSINSNIGKIVQQQIVLPQITRQSVQLQPAFLHSPPLSVQRSVLKASSPSIMEPQEFLVQQQTPDGQQKTYKLVRLPSTHPLASAVKAPQPPQVTPQIVTSNAQALSTAISIQGTALPPGYIVLKNNPTIRNNQGFQNVMQTVPIVINQACHTNPIILPNTVHTALTSSNKEEYVLPDAGGSKSSVSSNWNDDEVEILHPLEDNPPTDDELFNSIQEIIHSSNFEDITLRNVIDRVAAQYSAFDLTHRHNFMKDCVKKIIIGT